MWQISLQTDVVRGQWLEDYCCWLYREYYYLLARRGKKIYLHFHIFDDWVKAEQFFNLVKSAQNFSPENKPGIWSKIRNSKPLLPKKRNLLKRN